jgi:hypothetical protein
LWAIWLVKPRPDRVWRVGLLSYPAFRWQAR